MGAREITTSTIVIIFIIVFVVLALLGAFIWYCVQKRQPKLTETLLPVANVPNVPNVPNFTKVEANGMESEKPENPPSKTIWTLIPKSGSKFTKQAEHQPALWIGNMDVADHVASDLIVDQIRQTAFTFQKAILEAIQSSDQFRLFGMEALLRKRSASWANTDGVALWNHVQQNTALHAKTNCKYMIPCLLGQPSSYSMHMKPDMGLQQIHDQYKEMDGHANKLALIIGLDKHFNASLILLRAHVLSDSVVLKNAITHPMKSLEFFLASVLCSSGPRLFAIVVDSVKLSDNFNLELQFVSPFEQGQGLLQSVTIIPHPHVLPHVLTSLTVE